LKFRCTFDDLNQEGVRLEAGGWRLEAGGVISLSCSPAEISNNV
jgi:hypothetical protein